MPSTPVATGADRGQQLRCPYCHDVITHDDTAAACKVCRAPHHADCWYEGWGCSCCRHLEARHVVVPPLANVALVEVAPRPLEIRVRSRAALGACRATTFSGDRCSRRPERSGYCWQHAWQAEG